MPNLIDLVTALISEPQFEDENPFDQMRADLRATLSPRRELCARRAAFVAEARRAIAAGEDIGIMQCDEPCVTKWIGRRTDLVAEGLCTPDQFPDGKKRMKDGEINGRWWQTTKLARGHVAYSVRLTAEEQRCRYDEQRAAEREAEARGPDGEYGSVEAYTERAESVALRFKERLLDILSGSAERSELGSATLAYDRDTKSSAWRVFANSLHRRFNPDPPHGREANAPHSETRRPPALMRALLASCSRRVAIARSNDDRMHKPRFGGVFLFGRPRRSTQARFKLSG